MTSKNPPQELLDQLQAHNIGNLIYLNHNGPYYQMLAQEHVSFQQFSITKTFCTLACLKAVEEGFFSLDDNLGELLEAGFTKLRSNPEHYLSIGLDAHSILAGNYQLNQAHYQLKLHDLLALRIGHEHSCLFAKERQATSEQNWIELCLHKDFAHNPGTAFRYTNAGHYLAAVLTSLHTGQQLDAYLSELLGLISPEEKPHWDSDKLGFKFGASGLHITSTALARFALVLLNSGQSPSSLGATKQLISPQALSLMTTAYSNAEETKINAAYGMGLWIHENGAYSAQGTFGQLVYVDPQAQKAFVCNGNSQDMQELLKLLRADLLKAEL